MRGRRGVVLLAIGALPLAACGGSDPTSDSVGEQTIAPSAPPSTAATTAPPAAPAPAPTPAPKALPGLPADLAGFERWTRLNRRPIPPDSAESQRVGFDAHRSTKQVHLNPTAARRNGGGPFRNGSVIVKAGREGGLLTLVAIMRKVAGADGEHGDWRFREYTRTSAAEPFTTSPALTGATCWSCHAIAEPTDWVFTALTP